MVAHVKKWKVGDPRDPDTKVGSMIEKAHMEKVLGYIEAGRMEGAHLVTGGHRVRTESGGYFIELTIFDRVTNAYVCVCFFFFFLNAVSRRETNKIK